jgi:hypothetical protein
MLPHDSLEKSVTDAVMTALDEREKADTKGDIVGKGFRLLIALLVIIFLAMAMMGNLKLEQLKPQETSIKC